MIKIILNRKPNLYKKPTIGIDEFNNGVSIKGLPLVVCSYYYNSYPNSQKSNGPFERKKGFKYNKSQEKINEVINRAKFCLNRNPSFYYTPVENPLKLDGEYFLHLRALAISALILKNLSRWGYSKDLVVAIDKIDNNERSKIVGSYLENILSDFKLNIPIFFQERADENNMAVKKADRCAYFVALLKHFGEKWPHRTKKVNIESILKDCKNLDKILYLL